MSRLPARMLREKVRSILDTMLGYSAVWGLSITSVEKQNSDTKISGSFTSSFMGGKKHTFSITVDEYDNIIEAKIE